MAHFNRLRSLLPESNLTHIMAKTNVILSNVQHHTHTMESETMYYSRTKDNKVLLKIAGCLSGVWVGGRWSLIGIYVEQTHLSLPMNTSNFLHANPLQVVILGMAARDKAAPLFKNTRGRYLF